jgi:hypothetical protein
MNRPVGKSLIQQPEGKTGSKQRKQSKFGRVYSLELHISWVIIMSYYVGHCCTLFRHYNVQGWRMIFMHYIGPGWRHLFMNYNGLGRKLFLYNWTGWRPYLWIIIVQHGGLYLCIIMG